MATAASSDEFTFAPNGTYNSSHAGASTSINGVMQTYQSKYNGRYTAATWEVTLTNRQNGRATVYTANFQAVRGGRILRLTDKQAPGIQMSLVQVK